MRSLEELEIEPYDCGDGHVELTVRAPLDRWGEDDDETRTLAQVDAIAMQSAGILARLALIARDRVAADARDHKCREHPEIEVRDDGTVRAHWGEGCHVATDVDTMLHPGMDYGLPPVLWVTVPRKRARDYMRWLRETIADLGKPR